MSDEPAKNVATPAIMNDKIAAGPVYIVITFIYLVLDSSIIKSFL